MAEKTVRGRFVWHELMTPETTGAQAFYSKVLGWKSQPWEHDSSYSLFVAASGPVGGAVAQSNGAPHWLHSISTDDIDATVREATNRGGRVLTEITEIPGGMGKYAVLSDPQGASFGVHWSDGEGPPAGAPKRGEFSWHELSTTDYAAAFEFYSALFGWEKTGVREMGEGLGTYFMFGLDGQPLGGMMNMGPSPAWLGYVRVKNVDDVIKKAKAARGRLINGPMEVPGGDWIAQFLDPYGAPFAVHAIAADMKAGKAPAAAAPAEAPTKAPAAAPTAEPAAAAKPAKKAVKPAATQPAAKKPAAKKAPAKKAAAKKGGARKKAAKAKKKAAAAKKKGAPAKKSAKRPARKAGKKKVAAKKTRSGGKKKTAKRPRKGK
jgi:predicted enzyme related to lactoylglutathione lyase